LKEVSGKLRQALKKVKGLAEGMIDERGEVPRVSTLPDKGDL
tara:strand:+ start:523 stop:648 length:126 start_codon:yes stop_codon:yes gene_type:complete